MSVPKRMFTRYRQLVVEAHAKHDPRNRLHVHEHRRDGAMRLTATEYVALLKSKALEAAVRSTAQPYVCLTPEEALSIAHYMRSS